ncbi:MAG: transcriptional repressor [Bacteroides sp.]|nr:transcriptional repressor [Bacteroides sp.]
MQRMAIMDYLVEHRTHPSADEIYTALSPVMPTLSRTTVHNTLRLFAEQGAALMLTIDERNTNFDADTSAHAHFLCKECGKIYDLKSKLDTKVTEEFQSEGNEITEMHYYYKGICKNCLEHIID